MKKLLLLALVIAGLWQIKIPEKTVTNNATPSKSDVSEMAIHIDSVAFICDGREYCNQMTSYEEAVFFNKSCPDTKMDGNKNGHPCERQFGK